MGEAVYLRMLSVSRVTPSHLKLELSFLDALWIATPPTQQLFLYELAVDGEVFPAVVRRLKESLPAALALYLPLAGMLAHASETGDVLVDCSDAGLDFFEAEVDEGSGRMDVRRLVGDEAHDVPAFISLVPQHDARVLPAPAMIVQATRLGANGLALGLSVHHAVVDGLAMGRFMDAWTSISRGGSTATKSSHYPPPRFRREAIVHPRAAELARQVLNKVAPNLPVASAKEDYFSQRFQLARRTFHLSADDVRSLKLRVAALASAAIDGGNNAHRRGAVSTFAALCALGWTAFVRSKGLAAGDDTHLVFQADLRARLRAPVRDGYFGNCIRPCLASADAGDLLGGDAGLLRAWQAVEAAVREVEAAAALAGTSETWIERLVRLPVAGLVWVAGSPQFRTHEAADFGFGRPVRVEPVAMNHDGRMVLGAGARDGEAQVTVSLDPAHMETFKAHLCCKPRVRM